MDALVQQQNPTEVSLAVCISRPKSAIAVQGIRLELNTDEDGLIRKEEAAAAAWFSDLLELGCDECDEMMWCVLGDE